MNDNPLKRQSYGDAPAGRVRRSFNLFSVAAICLLFVVFVVACGRGADDPAPAGAPARVIPTMPPASFAQPTTMIGARQPTAIADTEESEEDEAADGEAATDASTEDVSTEDEAAVAEETPTPPVDLARGETIYGARGCAECHGEQAQGVPDAGSALAGLTLSESEFTNVLRTGGGIGPDHLYGPSAVSPGGVSVLYAWLQSLE